MLPPSLVAILVSDPVSLFWIPSIQRQKTSFYWRQVACGMEKLNLSADRTGDSPPLTGFSVGEWENAWARKLHVYGFPALRL